MKIETVEVGKPESKVGSTAATLPRWAKVLMAQHVEAAFTGIDSHHVQHCSDCGCAMIATSAAYHYSSNLCPECSTKIPKNQTSQGGN